MKRGNKKGMEIVMMAAIIIALATLALLVIYAFLLKGKGTGAITFLKNLLRFGS
jgi:hypothetical protein